MLRLQLCQYDFSHPEGLVIDRPQGTDYYLFILFNSSAEVFTDAGQWVYAKNHYIIYEPHHRQHYRSAGDLPYHNDFIDFICSEPELFNNLSIPLNVPVACPDTRKVRQITKDLRDLRFGLAQWRNEIAEAQLYTLFFHLSALIKTSESITYCHYLPALTELRGALYNKPKPGTTISELAKQIGLSASYFQSIYKAYFNTSVGQDIVNGRLEVAQQLLAGSTHSIEEISRLSGYESVSHFIRQFKKYIGQTPGKYRRSVPTYFP